MTFNISQPRAPEVFTGHLYLNGPQCELLEATEREVLIGGAKRGGKTVGSAAKAIALMSDFPGNKGVVIRQSLPDLKAGWLDEFLAICPPGFIVDHNKQEKQITARNGSRLLYTGAGDVVASKAAEKKKGMNVGFAIFEEGSEIKEEVYLMVTGQFSWKLPDGSRPLYQAIVTSNPEPGWVKRRFVGDLSTKTPPMAGTRFIPALPRDNADNLPPGWEQEMRLTRPSEWISKYLDGNWELSEGMVFEEFDRRIHLIEPFDYRNYKLWEVLDHASTGVTAYYPGAEDSDGNLFVLNEYWGVNKLVSEHSVQIHLMRNEVLASCFGSDAELYRRREGAPSIARFSESLIDPSTVAKNQQTAKGLESIMQMYADNGLRFAAAYNWIEAGIERFKEYLHPNPFHRHPFTAKPGAPMLYIVRDRCPNLVREIVELRKVVTDTGKVVYVGEDHGLDCIRYKLNAQSRPPKRTRGDLAKLPAQDRRAVEQHEAWAKKFGKTTGNRWFPPQERR